ncbi:flagellar hook-associated protein FlgK [Amaricoccus solimangrovi]|uniref:Flagellar hook-associated protein 1 n=1 Tax=Amaricoccus solimangrovi TaxID=2589815 RepID=A0A501WV69_9RHOB|nr:flagellar hook-associated protein FlgK [Amaricoccus solimangrovi]TPE53653.1 flagellar hook-associated protein FlgK [Amaricoccus solimangrovi]
MSISSALNNAASGLRAASKLAGTISGNVSNALTAGYAARATELSSLSAGGLGSGVRVVATTRAENAYLTSERRLAQASAAASGARSDAEARLVAAMGEAGARGSLSASATALETALMSASASPQSTTLLTAAADAARTLAGSLAAAAAEAAETRTEADSGIARQVAALNETLHRVEDLNGRITSLSLQGVDTLSLQDQRATLIDRISTIVPVRTVNRENGAVAIHTQGGATLLDGVVWELGFTPTPNGVTAEMTLGNGALSGLSQKQGTAIVGLAAGTGSGALDGGSLGALFEVRDTIVPGFTGELDLYAADLMSRFRDLAPAGALDAGGEGLFVDATGAGGTAGLAGRIALNAAVDPDRGGAVYRLRDGLAAASPGVEGNGSLLQALADAMAAAREPAGFVSQTAKAGSATMASEISAWFLGRSARTDDDLAFQTARADTLAEEELNAVGVDSDGQLQFLTVVEQAYAANARVLSVIDDLMRTLLEI